MKTKMFWVLLAAALVPGVPEANLFRRDPSSLCETVCDKVDETQVETFLRERHVSPRKELHEMRSVTEYLV
eukprot:4824641-Pyramimonas_sp.AAC.1